MNKKRVIRNIYMFLSLAMVLFGTLTPVLAEEVVEKDDEFYIEVGIDRSKDNPLDIKANNKFLYKGNNVSPGDVIDKKITFKNIMSEPIQVNISGIKVEKGSIFAEVLELEISHENSVIHQSKLTEVPSPALFWINIHPGQEITLDTKLHIPLNLDNRYQGAEVSTEWTFETRADVPDDPDEEYGDEYDYIEVVPTGDITKYNNRAYIAVAGGLVLVLIVLASKNKITKRED